MDNYQLYHWGIKGMKWGVRRYQNQDGSLTPAGRNRYGDEISNTAKKIKEKYNARKTAKALKAEKSKPKSAKDLSDEELRAKIERLRLEDTYNQLTRSLNPSEVSKGKQFVSGVLEASGRNIATQFATYAMGKAVNEIFAPVFNDASIVNPKKGQKDK